MAFPFLDRVLDRGEAQGVRKASGCCGVEDRGEDRLFAFVSGFHGCILLFMSHTLHKARVGSISTGCVSFFLRGLVRIVADIRHKPQPDRFPPIFRFREEKRASREPGPRGDSPQGPGSKGATEEISRLGRLRFFTPRPIP